MDFMGRLVEQKIRDAQAEGAFDNLPGRGKPLAQEDEAGVPNELRMCYKILKNANVLPPEMELKKDILTLQDLLAACEDEGERTRLHRRLTARRLQFDIIMEKRNAALPDAYKARVLDKFR